MQRETDFIEQVDQEVATKEAYRYFMRPDPDMRDFLGPIETSFDAVTNREMRWRTAKIGMVRGALEENMKDTVVYLDPFPHIRQDKSKDLQGWYSSKHDGLNPGQRDRPCETDAILTQPYGGYCAVGCTFCYVNSGSRGWRGSGLITVPLGFGAHVAKQLDSMKVSAAGYFSSFTDPFLPLEEYYHNSQRGAEAFVQRNLPIFFLSRLSYPGWAYDLLSKSSYSYAQKSINTPDQETWKRISPGAISLENHLDEIRALRKRDIYVSIQCNPIIPGIVSHSDVETLFEKLAAAGTNHVIVKFVEAGHAWARTMVERITKKFPDDRSAKFVELFVENSCGGQRTIVESYRREGHARYQKKATQLGMTYSLCYEYTRKTNGLWKSMGPEFLTSAQCHGHAVPIHENRSGQFHPMDVCPPSGCLRCAETHPGEAMCGSEILKQGKALRLPDLRNPYKKPVIALRSV
jgi:DNA repair photolyase